MLIDLPSTRPVFAYAQDYLHGERVELHRHSRAQLIHALSGVVTVGTAEGTWVVPPGRGVWLPAGIEHALRFAGQVRMRTLFIAPQARHDLPQDCRVMELILDELRVLPILALHVPQPVDPQLAALCRSLRAEPAADWSLGDAARRLGVSPRTLTRAFQRETGLSFVQWLRRMRLLASLDALAAGHSILEVALDLGYDSQSAFSAMFRRTLGVSPSLYFGRGAAYGVAEGD
ncbi:AraC family transcriptional regulator [Pseudomonas aeruginosa]|uniref:AraC family transcriptional regulator n=1 Tax=Pseudomonas aeruginosa TaxID=287 RepID=UPI000FC43644|nr:helix-turn-helix transcriptional regulator [Pseudomonas aeruginosa]RUE08070.1 AraC family transcriptional regulator [Pseudomonas aeruginosa]